MNALILYASMTGHSRKIARRLAENLSLTAVDLKKNPQLPQCDVLFLVSGIYGGECKQQLLEYVKQLNPQKTGKVVLLTSSNRGTAQGSLRRVLCEAGFTVEPEEFHCKGAFLFRDRGHPNAQELERAAAFAKSQLNRGKV